MHSTECTSRLLAAHRQAAALDLDKLFGSGIDITLSRYGSNDDQVHVERVTVAAEDFRPLRLVLIEALERTLERRRESVARELADLDRLLTP